MIVFSFIFLWVRYLNAIRPNIFICRSHFCFLSAIKLRDSCVCLVFLGLMSIARIHCGVQSTLLNLLSPSYSRKLEKSLRGLETLCSFQLRTKPYSIIVRKYRLICNALN